MSPPHDDPTTNTPATPTLALPQLRERLQGLRDLVHDGLFSHVRGGAWQ